MNQIFNFLTRKESEILAKLPKILTRLFPYLRKIK